MAPRNGQSDPRQSFQEALELVELPDESGGESSSSSTQVKRYLGTRAAWLPGSDLTELFQGPPDGGPRPPTHKAAFGGHVYAQAALATCRVLADAQKKSGVSGSSKLGLHSIHGYFTVTGKTDRPFIYAVTPLTSNPNFSTYSVTAHQPLTPSTNPARDHFPVSDARLPPGPTCFAALTSFKSAEPHTHGGRAHAAEPPPQERFGAILSSRDPSAWPPSPPIDIDVVTDLVGTDIVGSFPGADMKKVDMGGFNAGRPLADRRELVLYRLLRPLPSDDDDDDGGWDDANAHVCAHAYVADRNGLLMLANQLGLGRAYGKAASLTYSLVVHVNVDEAVMRGDGWWVLESSFPRAGAGRGVIMTKIWSPEGVHVATEYQDGLVKAWEERTKL